jgi:hypothetical protein
MWLFMVVLAVAALIDHSFALAGVLAGGALFIALTQK